MASDLKYINFLKTGKSFVENLVVLLVVKKKGFMWVCSFSIRLPNAKPAKIQTKRKQGFKKDFDFCNTSISLLSPFNEKCFCFKTFFMF